MTDQEKDRLKSTIKERSYLSNRLNETYSALRKMASGCASKKTKDANNPFTYYQVDTIKGTTAFKDDFDIKQYYPFFPVDKASYIDGIEKEMTSDKANAEKYLEEKIDELLAAQADVATRISDILDKHQWKNYFKVRPMDKHMAAMKWLQVYNQAHNVSVFLCAVPNVVITPSLGTCTMEILLTGLRSMDTNIKEIKKLPDSVLKTNIEFHFYAGVYNRHIDQDLKDLSKYILRSMKVIDGNVLMVYLKLKDFDDSMVVNEYY